MIILGLGGEKQTNSLRLQRVLHLDPQTAGRERDWAWNGLSKPQSSPPVTHFLQHGTTTSTKPHHLIYLCSSIPWWLRIHKYEPMRAILFKSQGYSLTNSMTASLLRFPHLYWHTLFMPPLFYLKPYNSIWLYSETYQIINSTFY